MATTPAAMERLYRRRRLSNAIALTLSLAATVFGLFWLGRGGDEDALPGNPLVVLRARFRRLIGAR